MIAAGARMAITRRANPLLDVTGGLLTLAAATTVGTIVPALLLKAGDAWSAWILQVSTGGQFTQRLASRAGAGRHAAPAVVLIFGMVAIVLSLVQAVLMLFRQAALVILAGVLPLAAAGSIAPMTRTWIRKVTSWMLALICYKPAAAAVYAAAFTMIGSGGSPRTMLMGFVMLAAVGAHAARADEVLHLDHRPGRRLRRRRAAARRRRGRRGRGRHDALIPGGAAARRRTRPPT